MTLRAETSRRRFLSQSACGVALASAGVTLSRIAAADDSNGGTSDIRRRQSFETNTRRPRGIAVGSDGRVYVAADRGVHVFDEQGSLLHTIKVDLPVRAVAVQSDALLIGLMHHVDRYHFDGRRVGMFCDLGGESLVAALATSDDAVYVADAASGAVHCYAVDGEIRGRLTRTGSTGAATPDFFSIAAGKNGVHVARPRRHRVERFSDAGELIDAFGGRSRDLSGFSGCCNPVSLATLRDGRIVTAERGVPRVKLYSFDGEFVAQLAGPDGFAENATASVDDDGYGCSAGGFDLAVDDRDRIYLLDRTTGRVAVLA